MRKRLNENYSKIVLGAAEKNWERNKSKMEEKGIDKNSYMLGYLHGYEGCYNTYEIDKIGDIVKEYSKKGEPTQ